MKNENLSLNKIIDLKKWQKLQDSIALVTKTAIITVDYKGKPVTEHSSCHRFCEEVRADSDMVKYCEKCDSRGGLEAIRLNEPYIYLCHYNIVDVAIPIIIDDKYIGAIMAGQVKLSDPNETKILEQIVTTSNRDLANKKLEDLKEYYEQLPLLSYEKVKELANMLSYLCNYLVEESIEKNLILQMYEKSLKSEVDSNALLGYPVKNIENVKKQISNAIIDAYIIEKPYDDGREVLVSTTLKPAIDYIYNNKSENISAENMANICHVSQGYFSRLFKKQTGENFSIYLAKLKIEWAKNLLEETDMPVNEVSQELGFSESGYFIKIFKKYEGVTPSIYRKYFKKI
ncbi:PocR ligand-binding domain-containing protein [Clostridium gasigenes]|uniref:PocR ligand-binding domain-containing protein n=1 Tax=Clostridium gasigenes TaxID=94869 RepID=A0A7X0SE03_9CLOT|nr:PocR ligand-binding domain-containing protein [Clostridium gasigenes]MBB6713846.1 PocR ligand-binding domain-containing protein [Clostridium gasigenes]MBU3087106.1 PocR ligand-binding domain-containing protein [Clostridium gasigenes]